MNCRFLFLTQISSLIVQSQVLLYLFFFSSVLSNKIRTAGEYVSSYWPLFTAQINPIKKAPATMIPIIIRRMITDTYV